MNRPSTIAGQMAEAVARGKAFTNAAPVPAAPPPLSEDAAKHIARAVFMMEMEHWHWNSTASSQNKRNIHRELKNLLEGNVPAVPHKMPMPGAPREER